MRNSLISVVALLVLWGCTTPQISRIPQLQVGTDQHPFEISGVLSADLRLSGVIRLTGDLLIPAGRSLWIAPGSSVLVVGNDSSKIDPEFLDKGTEILVKGSLIVAGEGSAPVRFALDPATPAGENWSGIELIGAQTTQFSHVDIFAAETGILSIDSSPRLEQVNILGARNGLLLQGGGVMDFHGGRISGGDAGLLCFDRASLALNQVQIVDNLEEGMYLAPGCSVKAQDVAVERNDLGLVALASTRAQLTLSLHSNRIDFKPLPVGVISK